MCYQGLDNNVYYTFTITIHLFGFSISVHSKDSYKKVIVFCIYQLRFNLMKQVLTVIFHGSPSAWLTYLHGHYNGLSSMEYASTGSLAVLPRLTLLSFIYTFICSTLLYGTTYRIIYRNATLEFKSAT